MSETITLKFIYVLQKTLSKKWGKTRSTSTMKILVSLLLKFANVKTIVVMWAFYSKSRLPQGFQNKLARMQV